MTLPFSTFKIAFGVGLGLAATAFVFVMAGRVTTNSSAAYLAVAVLHIGVLVAIAVKLDLLDRAASPGWLYTAGFLHTLLALGVAIATAGLQLGNANEGNLVDALGKILLPMGAAVLPHAMGVLAGQLLERPGSEGTGQAFAAVEQLTRQAEQGYRSLSDLFTRREALLRQEITLLEQHVNHWQQTERALSTMIARVNALSTEIERANHAATGLRGSLDTAAGHARALAPALQDAVQVVGDLKKLQESIVDLLQRKIFHHL